MPLNLLIVEDEAMLLTMLEWEFDQRGCRVRSAHNGVEAIQEIERDLPDLILLDLLMPRVDGFGVLAYLRERSVSTPVIVLSNLHSPEDQERCFALGAKDFLVKSALGIDELASKVLGNPQVVETPAV